MIFGKGRAPNNSGTEPAERPDFLGRPLPAKHVTRTSAGYLAAVSDDFGHRTRVGMFGTAAEALTAARSAFEHMLDREAGLEAA
jgi:hypothetical protein